jgi:geranylgeranylglycerol-phosphate geranylgeranyltransferase
MLELLGMTRPLNGLMTMIGVFVGALVSAGLEGIGVIPFLLALAAVFLVNSAGNVFNDCMDVGADKVNRPGRPLPSGRVSKNAALAFSLVLFVAGNLCALLINGLCVTIALINSLLLIAYSVSLQHKTLIGNVVIAYLVGSVFLFGGAVFLDFIKIWTVVILAGLAMLANMAREIVKDLEDMEGDKKSFLKKLASKTTTRIAERFGVAADGVKLKYKERTMLVIALACIALAVVFSALPYYYGTMKLGYLAIIVLADVAFVSSAISLSREQKRKKGYTRISKRLKIAMFIALVAFVAGAIL